MKREGGHGPWRPWPHYFQEKSFSNCFCYTLATLAWWHRCDIRLISFQTSKNQCFHIRSPKKKTIASSWKSGNLPACFKFQASLGQTLMGPMIRVIAIDSLQTDVHVQIQQIMRFFFRSDRRFVFKTCVATRIIAPWLQDLKKFGCTVLHRSTFCASDDFSRRVSWAMGWVFTYTTSWLHFQSALAASNSLTHGILSDLITDNTYQNFLMTWCSKFTKKPAPPRFGKWWNQASIAADLIATSSNCRATLEQCRDRGDGEG